MQDYRGRIQLYIKSESLLPTDVATQGIGFADLGLLDIGDIVEVGGKVTKTQRGMISVEPSRIRLLAKSIRPLPEKWEGVQDPEIKYRQRYLDIIMNPGVKEMFERKARFWQANRDFMKKHGFTELETPIMENVTGGADAAPFMTHHNALDQDFYLRISTELYLKRLIGAGFEKIYTLGPNFRNEGIDDEHLQEFYQIEWYWAFADYHDNMAFVKEMIRHVALEVYGTTKFTKGTHTFDLGLEWEEIDYIEAIKNRFSIDIFTATEAELLDKVRAEKIELGVDLNRNRLIDNLWKVIRREISGPAFLVNEPKFMSPLAKSKVENPQLTERFHVVIAGSELGNGYSELNDPVDQLDRFREQQAARDKGDTESQMLDVDYVEMLEYGMPPVSGYAHSERLFWFLEGVSAREGTLFPQMRRKVTELQKQIYGLK